MLKSKIQNRYERHDCKRVCQGDILRDLKFKAVKEEEHLFDIFLPYAIVLSQDCDLHYGLTIQTNPTDQSDGQLHNQFLPNILFSPAFPAELAKDGTHLYGLFNVVQDKKDSQTWKLIKQNHNERYYFLQAHTDYQIPDLLIDFKTYYTLPKDYFLSLYNACYLATVNELFREHLSQRFSNYLNRIGLPDLKTPSG